MSETYRIPTATTQVEIEVLKSRFIATALFAGTPAEAKTHIDHVRVALPGAHHHVYAFRVGYGARVIEGMSDDGEPAGTAGPPVLAVIRGTDIGDLLIVVTRYFGGTKLGTGGLVRAYTDAAKAVMAVLPTEIKIEKVFLLLEVPYTFYAPIKRLLTAYEGLIQEESFTDNILLQIQLPLQHVGAFQSAIRDLTAGNCEVIII